MLIDEEQNAFFVRATDGTLAKHLEVNPDTFKLKKKRNHQ